VEVVVILGHIGQNAQSVRHLQSHHVLSVQQGGDAQLLLGHAEGLGTVRDRPGESSCLAPSPPEGGSKGGQAQPREPALPGWRPGWVCPSAGSLRLLRGARPEALWSSWPQGASCPQTRHAGHGLSCPTAPPTPNLTEPGKFVCGAAKAGQTHSLPTAQRGLESRQLVGETKKGT
jgi:hypothetical protein